MLTVGKGGALTSGAGDGVEPAFADGDVADGAEDPGAVAGGELGAG